MNKRALAPIAAALPGLAQAASFDAGQMAVTWAMPFVGLLLSIALMPLLLPRFWHHHFGKVSAGWSLLFLLPFTAVYGPQLAAENLSHALLADYLPFIILLTALYTVAGGIHIRGNLKGTPGLNVALMAIGAVLASFMGTTGASILMVRPLIRANDNRRHAAHVFVFFIFIVSNAGGALTPLGDPPLFLGFLKGVDFFWTLQHLFLPTVFLIACLLLIFWRLDRFYFDKEGVQPVDPTPDTPFALEGRANLLLLPLIMGLVLMSGLWKPEMHWSVLGAELGLASLVRDAALLGVTALSLWLTPTAVRESNQFNWGAMQEVAKLFAGIFLTIIPVLAMLRAGLSGPFAGLLHAVTGADGQPLPWAYFWFSGGLSSFLDNAPTYLVFFNMAGGNPQQLMGSLAPLLAAMSAGSVFMGANSYIGNAPNFMVKAIVEGRGIRMPSFFGYMAWSSLILLPLFVLMTFLFFT